MVSRRARRDTSLPVDCGSRTAHCAAETGWCPRGRCRITAVAGALSICRITFATASAWPQRFNRYSRYSVVQTMSPSGSTDGGSLPTAPHAAVLRLELNLEIERLVARRERHHHWARAAIEHRKARVQLGRGCARGAASPMCDCAWGRPGSPACFRCRTCLPAARATTNAEMPTIPLAFMAIPP